MPTDVRCFRSRYNGTCQICHKGINVGDYIAWKRNEYLAHASCHHDSDIQDELSKAPQSQQAAAEDIYWKNKAAALERKQEEAAYQAKTARNDAMPF